MSSDPFRELMSGLNAKLSGSHLGEQRDREAEEAIAVFVLKHYGLEGYKRELKQLCRETYNVPALRLEMLQQRFPTFPVYLAFRRVKKLFDKTNLSSLFTSFVSLPFMDDYGVLLDSLEQGLLATKPVGMVFPWRALPGGMVLHNCELDQTQSGVKLLWVYRNKKAKKVQRLVLEPLSSLLRTISQWTPDE